VCWTRKSGGSAACTPTRRPHPCDCRHTPNALRCFLPSKGARASNLRVILSD
jgi:hypothetical protein